MALQDILDAISAEADKKIADARTAHQRELMRMREESERTIARKKQELVLQKQMKMDQLKNKAVTHASSQKRNAVLLKKRELLDRTYAPLAAQLAKLSDDDIEPLLRACIKKVRHNGVIHPSVKHEKLLRKICPSEQFTIDKPTKSAGGFLFVSEKEEQDFTFENLIEKMLRPKTELAISQMLFS